MKIYFPAFVIIIIDQLTKSWVKSNFQLYESREILGSFLKFSYVNNTGIAFGISVGDFGILLTILSIFATLFIIYYHWLERHNHLLISLGLSFILGGAIGNLIDRISIFFVNEYKGVVDFIDVGIGASRWYIFNIADTAVTIGIFLYILHSIIINKKSNIEENV